MLGNCVFKGSADIFTHLFLQALSMLVTYLMQYYFLPCRIESYSCKMAGDDKHMFKQFCQEGEPHVLEALSPPQSTSATSPSQWVVQLRSRAVLHQELSSKFRRDNVEFPFSSLYCPGWGRAVRMGRTLWVTSVAGRLFSTSSRHSMSPSGQTTTSARHGPTSSAESPASTGLVCCSFSWVRIF